MARDTLYPKEPVIIVYKQSERKNAITKMKIVKGRNIDELIGLNFNIAGIHETDIIIAVGIGDTFEAYYKTKYNLTQ
jgi:hypothetical protein